MALNTKETFLSVPVPEKNFLEWNQPLDRNDRAIQYKNVRIRVATLATHLAVKFLAP
jgi:hypothetical protein